MAEVATIQPVVVMIITLTLKRLIHLLKLKKVTIDNTAVTDAVATAKDSGVKVTQDATQDKGTPTTSEDLATKSKLKSRPTKMNK